MPIQTKESRSLDKTYQCDRFAYVTIDTPSNKITEINPEDITDKDKFVWHNGL